MISFLYSCSPKIFLHSELRMILKYNSDYVTPLHGFLSKGLCKAHTGQPALAPAFPPAASPMTLPHGHPLPHCPADLPVSTTLSGQSLGTCRSLCLEGSSPATHMVCHLCSWTSLVKCHLSRGVFYVQYTPSLSAFCSLHSPYH